MSFSLFVSLCVSPSVCLSPFLSLPPLSLSLSFSLCPSVSLSLSLSLPRCLALTVTSESYCGHNSISRQNGIQLRLVEDRNRYPGGLPYLRIPITWIPRLRAGSRVMCFLRLPTLVLSYGISWITDFSAMQHVTGRGK